MLIKRFQYSYLDLELGFFSVTVCMGQFYKIGNLDVQHSKMLKIEKKRSQV